MATYPARHISTSIARSVSDVYEFMSNPLNAPQWAAGLSSGIEQHGDVWITDSPMGKVRVKFAPRNVFGVVDHDVTMMDGTVVHNPLRVMPRGDDASEVVFTLFRREDMSDEEYERDAAAIAADLKKLKEILEKR
jgi:hypothetical protein